MQKTLVFLSMISQLSMSAWASPDSRAGEATADSAKKSLQDKTLAVSRSKVAFVIPDKTLFPEGLAYDSVEQSFYLGSTYKRKIVRVDQAGRIDDFTSEGQDGIYQVLGLKIDAGRRVLWACSAAESEHPELDGYSGIFKYDLRTGRLIRKYLFDNKAGPHLFNDLMITASGDAFFTDSRAGAVYTIEHERDAIEIFIAPGTFDYPNGIALSSDEDLLFIAHAQGIDCIVRSTKRRFNLAAPRGEVIKAIDGMYFYRDSLVGIQIGRHTQRVVQLPLNAKMNQVIELRVLEADNPLFDSPTTGCVAAGKFYFIGNSQMNKLGNDGTIISAADLQEIKILRLDL